MPARTDEGPERLKRADRLVGEAMAFEGVVHEQQEDVTFVRSPSNRVSPTQTNGKAEAFNKKILQ